MNQEDKNEGKPKNFFENILTEGIQKVTELIKGTEQNAPNLRMNKMDDEVLFE